MPIYEYRCPRCGEFEITQKITDKSLTRCPTCKGRVRKLISNTSFHLKGTGWYLTDYARKDKTPKPKSPPAEAKGDGKAASTTDGGKSTAEKSAPKSVTSESTAP